MAIGAEDYIDQLLVQKYATEKVDNHDGIESMVSPEKMMSAMQDYSTVSKHMFALNAKLTAACASINALSAQYRKAATLEG